jgi:cytochrome c oxidase cbb3-type subunit III
MSRLSATLIPISRCLISAMVVMALHNEVNAGSQEKPSSSQEFVLPQKHTTSLSKKEKKGQALYVYYCSLCHGESGNADGFNAPNMRTHPAKHSDATLMATLSDSQIQQIIQKGGPVLGRSPEMPPWGNVLTNQEIADLTAFIRTLSLPLENKTGH